MSYSKLMHTNLILNEIEIRALGRILEKEWINPEDTEVRQVVTKLFRTINDMDTRTNSVNE